MVNKKIMVNKKKKSKSILTNNNKKTKSILTDNNTNKKTKTILNNKKKSNKKRVLLNKTHNINEIDESHIEKTIIKNVIKGGFCSKYKNDACNKISIKMDPIAPIGDFLNFILNIVQDGPLRFLTDGFAFIIKEWNIGLTHLSTTIERFIILIIFTINGYTNTLNFMLDEVKLILRILVVILTNGNPFIIITIYLMPVINELLSFVMDSGTLDVVTSLFTFNFTPLYHLMKAFLHLLIGKTVKNKCNLEDYGNNKSYMNSECYEFVVPKCKLNIKTLFYFTFIITILIYISSWISFFKLFYPD
tara:strand:+ start:495 stop:1403 length:909 start_codon:yes stop_codon:yes gene_type:complete